MEAAALPNGSRIERFVIEDVLGQGGNATVYLARDEVAGVVRAIKVLDMPGPVVRERLMRERKLQSRLRHPNVVRVHELVTVGDAPGLVMEFVDGPTLGQEMKRRRLRLDEVDSIAQGVLRGMRAVHRLGAVHRDLKPSNILLQRTEDGFVAKVADFGLAKVLVGTRTASNTRSGQVMGSPPFMAPEQIRDSKSVDRRADVFSLGTLLYRMVTGRRPFDSPDVIELFVQISTGDFVPPRVLVPDLPERMERAILGALVVEPDERIQSVDHLLAVWLDRPPPKADGPRRAPAEHPRLPSVESLANQQLDSPAPTSETPVWIAVGATAVVLVVVSALGAWWWL